MQDYYVKNGRRYERAGYISDNMPDGLYFRQSDKYSTRITSLAYWLGTNPKQPVDVNRLISTMQLDEKLSAYLNSLTKDSDEFRQLKEDCGGYVKSPIEFYNISPQDLALAVLRFINSLDTTANSTT